MRADFSWKVIRGVGEIVPGAARGQFAVVRGLREPYTVALEIDDYFADGARFDQRVSGRDGGR